MSDSPSETQTWFDDDTGVTVRSRGEAGPSGQSHVVVAFGGLHIGKNTGTARYEFLRLLSELPVDVVAVRDLDQCWYQQGIAGLAETPTAAAEKLKARIGELKPSKVTVVGASAGGFGALAIGSLCGADRIISFSPQTFLTQRLRLRHGDLRWRHQARKAQRAAAGRSLDLLELLASTTVPMELHYATKHRLDRVHAQHVASLPHLRLVEHDSDSHHLVQDLRRTGQLESVLLGDS